MKHTAICIVMAISLLLSGCGMLIDGDHVWEQNHSIPTAPDNGLNISANDYAQLYEAMTECVESARSQMSISVALYDRDHLEPDINRAIETLLAENPVAAYAVQQIHYEVGTSGGEIVLALQIDYLHNQSDIEKIILLNENTTALDAIAAALNNCDTGVVLRIHDYEETDFIQIVEDYATEHPEYVMEVPQVSVNHYPRSGSDRVVELRFLYQNSRDTLRNMQSQVLTLFDAAEDMVSLTVQARGKYTQMYVLLMELIQEYTLDTSITPAYSLFLYGVGDAKAFATVYSAMCRRAGLVCLNVVGTRNGEVWYWNIVQIDGVYYHVDLLRSKEEGQFREMTDAEMEGYVWDFSAYPLCGTKE